MGFNRLNRFGGGYSRRARKHAQDGPGSMNDTEGNDVLRRRFDRLDAIILCVLTGVILLYFRQILWTREYIYGELDIRRHFYFFKLVSFELMRAGELPLWIPHIYCGMPLLAASQVTPFYPVDLVLMLTGAPVNMVFNWDLLIHLMAAQVFSYLLFKRLFGRGPAAVFGAVWFWNVFFLNSISTGDALNIRGMLLAPVVFYFVEAGMGEEGRPRDFLFGALALSMQLLCGGLQNTFYTMAAVGAYAVFRLVCRAREGEEVLRPVLGFAGMIAAGMAISGVQLLPAWEYSQLSVRSTGFEWYKVWAIEPYQLIGYVMPMFEGRGTEHGYFGLAPLVLAAFALSFWRSPRKYFFLALGALAIVYSFGGHTTISSFIAGLPLVRDFRGPFRGAIFFNFSVFALAAGAVAGMSKASESGAGKRALPAFAVTGILLIAGFVVTAACARRYPGFDAGVVLASAVFLALSIVAVCVLVFSRFKAHAAGALVALLLVDLALNYGGLYSPARVSDLFRKDPGVASLEEGVRVASSRIAVYDTAHTNYFGLFGIESATGHHPFPTTRYSMFLPLLKRPHVASLAGVDRYVVYARDGQHRPHDPPVNGAEEVSISEAPIPALPRAFLVNRYRALPTAEVLDAVRDRRFRPESEVILERQPPRFEPSEDVSAPGSAVVVSRRANEVAIETESDHGSILVLTESYYPGWKAEIDGSPAEILRANYVFRAVVVPEGNHEVVFRFRPASFIIGAIVSCVGAICWLAWGLGLLLRRKA